MRGLSRTESHRESTLVRVSVRMHSRSFAAISDPAPARPNAYVFTPGRAPEAGNQAVGGEDEPGERRHLDDGARTLYAANDLLGHLACARDAPERLAGRVRK